MMLMFARMLETIDALTETLKSRNLWTADDERAFRHLVHHDKSRLERYVAQASKDYTRLAHSLGVVTDLKP